MEFEKFRDYIDGVYEEVNNDSSIRMEIPSDERKFEMLIAIEAYFRIKQEEIMDEVFKDMFNPYSEDEDDFDWDDFLDR